MFEVDKD